MRASRNPTDHGSGCPRVGDPDLAQAHLAVPAHQAVQVAHPERRRRVVHAVDERHEPGLPEHEVVELEVDPLARSEVVEGGAALDESVDVRARQVGGVVVAVALEGQGRQPVGFGIAAPPGHVEGVLAAVEEALRGDAGVQHLDVHGDSDPAQHRAHDLRRRDVQGVVVGGGGELEPVGLAGLAQELPRTFGIVGRSRGARLVGPRADGPHAGVGQDRVVEVDGRVDGPGVDGVHHGAPQARVVERRHGHVEGEDVGDAAARHGLDPEAAVPAERGHVLVGQVGDIDLAGAQRRDQHRLVADHSDRHLVQVGQAVAGLVDAPVVVVAHEVDGGAGDDARDAERTGAGWVPAIVSAELPYGARGVHDPAPVGEHVEPRTPRPLQVEADPVLAQHVDRVDHRHGGAGGGHRRGIENALDVELDRLGIERRAVVEADALAQFERDGVRGFGNLPGGREGGRGPRREVGIGVDELVEDLPPVVGVAPRPA